MPEKRLLRSINGIIDAVPLHNPHYGTIVTIDPLKVNGVPEHLKHNFFIDFTYKKNIPFDAVCTLLKDDKVFTIVIIINEKFEKSFEEYLKNEKQSYFDIVCNRKELYYHEFCHLLALIQACPDNFPHIEGIKKFEKSISAKFKDSLNEAVAEILISLEKEGCDPCNFDISHFTYTDTSLDYGILFSELMLKNDAIKNLDSMDIQPAFEEYCKQLLISDRFKRKFPQKLIESFAKQYFKKQKQ